MGELAKFIEEHPAAIFFAVGLVAIVAFLQTRGSGGGSAPGDIVWTGGGVQAPPMDPNIAAVEQARIAANSSNLSYLASLFLGEQQSTDALNAHLSDNATIVDQSGNALTSSLAGIAAGRDVAIHDSDNSLTASLSQTAAERAAALAGIQAGVDVAHEQAYVATSVAGIQSEAQIRAAQITADAYALIAKSQSEAAARQAQAEAAAIQAQKDQNHSNNNTDIWGHVIDGIGNVIAWVFGNHGNTGGFSGGGTYGRFS